MRPSVLDVFYNSVKFNRPMMIWDGMNLLPCGRLFLEQLQYVKKKHPRIVFSFVCEYLIQQLHHSVIVSLKGSRSMVVFPPQEAVSGLWLPPASMRQKALGLSRGPAGRGGQPVTWKWLLTLWSKGQHQASPATGRAGSHALPCWRLTEVAEQSKGKTTCCDLSENVIVHVCSPNHSFQIS